MLHFKVMGGTWRSNHWAGKLLKRKYKNTSFPAFVQVLNVILDHAMHKNSFVTHTRWLSTQQRRCAEAQEDNRVVSMYIGDLLLAGHRDHQVGENYCVGDVGDDVGDGDFQVRILLNPLHSDCQGWDLIGRHQVYKMSDMRRYRSHESEVVTSVTSPSP